MIHSKNRPAGFPAGRSFLLNKCTNTPQNIPFPYKGINTRLIITCKSIKSKISSYRRPFLVAFLFK